MADVKIAEAAPVPLSLKKNKLSVSDPLLPDLVCKKRYIRKLTVFLLLIAAPSAWGQTAKTPADSKILSIGLGPEVNLNSGSGMGMGAIAAIDFSFAKYWAAGVTAKGSYDLSSAWVAEGGALIRYYLNSILVSRGKEPWQGVTHSGFFLQAEGGVHYIAQDNVFLYDGDTLLRPMGGGRIGWRFLLGNYFYAEPYGRGGYPFLWGAGLVMGIRL